MSLSRQIVIVGVASISWLSMLGLAAQANDASLNLKVSPPQLLGEGDVPVRMEAEHITVHFGSQRSQVEVEFTFKNLSDHNVICWAGFPDEDLLYRYLADKMASGITEDELLDKYDIDGMLVYGEVSGDIQNFTAWSRAAGEPATERTPLPYKLLRIESLASEIAPEAFPKDEWMPAQPGMLLLCRAFELSFEPGQELTIGHSYDAATGGNVETQSLFQYQLVTGRNWQGTIGEAVIDVFVNDDLAEDGLFFGTPENPDFHPVTTPGKDELKPVAPGHYRCVWRDFEPEGDKGWIYLASPPRWYKEQEEENTSGPTP